MKNCSSNACTYSTAATLEWMQGRLLLTQCGLDVLRKLGVAKEAIKQVVAHKVCGIGTAMTCRGMATVKTRVKGAFMQTGRNLGTLIGSRNQIKRRNTKETCTALGLPLIVHGIHVRVSMLEMLQGKLEFTVKDAKKADGLSQSSDILELQSIKESDCAGLIPSYIHGSKVARGTEDLEDCA